MRRLLFKLRLIPEIARGWYHLIREWGPGSGGSK